MDLLGCCLTFATAALTFAIAVTVSTGRTTTTLFPAVNRLPAPGNVLRSTRFGAAVTEIVVRMTVWTVAHHRSSASVVSVKLAPDHQ